MHTLVIQPERRRSVTSGYAPTTEFDMPLAAAGSGFERKIWRLLAAIPYGQTRSHSQRLPAHF